MTHYHRRCPHDTRDGYGCPWCGDVVPGVDGARPWWTPIWRVAWVIGGMSGPLLWLPSAFVIGRAALWPHHLDAADWFARMLIAGWSACAAAARIRSTEGKVT